MLTIQQLRSPMSSQSTLAVLLLYLKNLGFHTGSWHEGSIQRTILTTVARLVSDLTELSRIYVEFALNDYSSGDPLVELSDNVYDNQASAAVKTNGVMTLTNNSSGPYTVSPGQLIVGTTAGVQFGNLTGGNLAAGGTLDCTFEALLAGASGNVANGAVTILHTSLAGVTVQNGVVGGAVWYSITGADAETTLALRTRNRTKWATLGIELIADGYRNLALSVSGIEKVAVDDSNPRGPGTIDVYVASANNTVGTTEKTALQVLFSQRVFGTDPNYPPDEDSYVHVLDAATQTLTLNGTVYHDPGYASASVRAAVETALNAFVLGLPLGGENLAPGPSNVIPIGDIYEVIERVQGVRTVKLIAPSTDVDVGTTSLVVAPAVWGLTYTPSVSQ